VDLVSEARLLIKDWIQIDTQHKQNGGADISTFWSNQFDSLRGDSPKAYRIAEALAKLMSERNSLGATSSPGSYLEQAKRAQGPSNPFHFACVISAFKDSISSTPFGTRLCNEWVADITGLDPNNEAEG
jgi:hypothetical protein